MESRLPYSKAAIAELPTATGVYWFLDADQKVLYVGKALNLRSRVRSYFGAEDGRLVTRLLGSKAAWIDWTITGSEKEALLLENAIIKRERPKLNIRLTDDKTYFSLRLDESSRWPRLTIVRRRKDDAALYFGPYPSAQACRKTIQFMSRIFPLRTCRDSILDNRSRPCVLHEIGRCTAPCVDLVSKADYDELVRKTVRFLSGQDRAVLAELEQSMHLAAEALEFERAADLRDRLAQVRRTLDLAKVSRGEGAERDVVGICENKQEVFLAVVQIRDGNVIGTDHFRFRRLGGADEVLAAFLGQYYGPVRRPPAEILLPSDAADLELHHAILEERRGGPVSVRVPERGEGLRLVRIAERNAALKAIRRRQDSGARSAQLAELKEQFGLGRLPRRIECFDISHLMGDHVVGSRVTFMDGLPEKSLYRHYKLRAVQRNDDFAAMEEVLTRRLRRGVAEHDLPDLLVVDGGPPQLARAERVLRDLSIAEVSLLGLAKARNVDDPGSARGFERIWVPGRASPHLLDPLAESSKLLVHLRDEAHRFAVGFHRRERAKTSAKSVVADIPGLGARRAQALLRHLGSLSSIRAASLEELTAVPGISSRLAASVHAWLIAHPKAGDVGSQAERPSGLNALGPETDDADRSRHRRCRDAGGPPG